MGITCPKFSIYRKVCVCAASYKLSSIVTFLVDRCGTSWSYFTCRGHGGRERRRWCLLYSDSTLTLLWLFALTLLWLTLHYILHEYIQKHWTTQIRPEWRRGRVRLLLVVVNRFMVRWWRVGQQKRNDHVMWWQEWRKVMSKVCD